jgi:hypothetical protein
MIEYKFNDLSSGTCCDGKSKFLDNLLELINMHINGRNIVLNIFYKTTETKFNTHEIYFCDYLTLKINGMLFDLCNIDALNLVLSMIDIEPNFYLYQEITRIIWKEAHNGSRVNKKITIDSQVLHNNNINDNNVNDNDNVNDDDNDEMNRILGIDNENAKTIEQNNINETNDNEKKRIFRPVTQEIFNREIYTYEKILESTLEHNNGIIDLNNLPVLFASKFPIYLWMNGKDLQGNQINKNMLRTNNSHDVFNMLYRSLYDDDYELPDDDEKLQIINDFNNFLPSDFNSETVDEIMHKMNTKSEKTNEEYEVFRNYRTAESGIN